MKIYAVKILDISEERIKHISLLIDLDKRYKIERFINKKDKIRSLISEILIRSIIIKELNINNIMFQKNKYGKPYLKDYKEFNFNLSHSGDFVVCAIDNKNIGIDIEKIKHIDHKGIAENFFTENEFDYIMKKDSNSQLNKFYEIWTLKESYIKCCGQGLSIPLKSFSMDIDKYQNIKVITNNEQDKHIFKQFHIDSGYEMSICSLNSEISNNIIKIDQNSLINNYCRFVLA